MLNEDEVTERHRDRAHAAHAACARARRRLEEVRNSATRHDGRLRPGMIHEAALRSEEVEMLKRRADACDADLKHAEADADRRRRSRDVLDLVNAEIADIDRYLDSARAEVARLECEREQKAKHGRILERESNRTQAELDRDFAREMEAA